MSTLNPSSHSTVNATNRFQLFGLLRTLRLNVSPALLLILTNFHRKGNTYTYVIIRELRLSLSGATFASKKNTMTFRGLRFNREEAIRRHPFGGQTLVTGGKSILDMEYSFRKAFYLPERVKPLKGCY